MCGVLVKASYSKIEHFALSIVGRGWMKDRALCVVLKWKKPPPHLTGLTQLDDPPKSSRRDRHQPEDRCPLLIIENPHRRDRMSC